MELYSIYCYSDEESEKETKVKISSIIIRTEFSSVRHNYDYFVNSQFTIIRTEFSSVRHNYDYRCGNREKVKVQTSKLKHQRSKIKHQIKQIITI